MLAASEPIKYKGRRISLKQAVDRLAASKNVMKYSMSHSSEYDGSVSDKEPTTKNTILSLASFLDDRMDNYRLN